MLNFDSASCCVAKAADRPCLITGTVRSAHCFVQTGRADGPSAMARTVAAGPLQHSYPHRRLGSASSSSQPLAAHVYSEVPWAAAIHATEPIASVHHLERSATCSLSCLPLSSEFPLDRRHSSHLVTSCPCTAVSLLDSPGVSDLASVMLPD